jgi:ABC-type cobalamin transport system permease subunit
MNEASQTIPPVRVSTWWLIGQAVLLSAKGNVIALIFIVPLVHLKFQVPVGQVVGASLGCAALYTAYIAAEVLLFHFFGVRNVWFGAAIGALFGAAMMFIWDLAMSEAFDPKRLVRWMFGGFALGRFVAQWLNRKIPGRARRAAEPSDDHYLKG